MPYFAWQGRHKGRRNTAFDAFFANPETPALSPMLPLYYWLDPEQATRADRQIRLLIGAVGAYVLLSAWLANVSLWALLSFCLLYLGNGALAGHTLVGHGMAGALFVLPLIMGLFLRAANRNHAGLFPSAAVACGGLLALMNRVARWQPSVQRTGSWFLAGALLVGLAIDLRYQNFERRRETLLIHPYPPIASARIAAIRFGSPEGDVEARPVARGVNWAQYQYRQLLPDGEPRRVLSLAGLAL